MPLSDVYLRKLKIGDKPKHADGGGLYLFLCLPGECSGAWTTALKASARR